MNSNLARAKHICFFVILIDLFDRNYHLSFEFVKHNIEIKEIWHFFEISFNLGEYSMNINQKILRVRIPSLV